MQNSSEQQNVSTQIKENFSFSALIVSILLSFLAFKFFQLLDIVNSIYDFFKSDNFIAQLLTKYLEKSSKGEFNGLLSFFHIWIWVVFISYCVKTFVSIKQIFNPTENNILAIGWIAMFFEVLPIFFKIWSTFSIEEAVKTMLFVYAPTLIGLALLNSKENV